MSLRKPYRSVDGQLRILRMRGMAVDADAGHVLRREGYYPVVNGYKDLFFDRKACLAQGDDRYENGARFDDLYALFLFDRELRELLFSAITRAGASLKASCAHEFTRLHPDEVNPYLNPDYYDPTRRSSAVALIDKVFKRILELDGNPRNKGAYGVSQRTLTRMLDAGMIPYTRMGERSYRFLRLSDVTDYKRRRDEATSKALDEMRSIADEDGAYDIDYSDYLSRFDK